MCLLYIPRSVLSSCIAVYAHFRPLSFHPLSIFAHSQFSPISCSLRELPFFCCIACSQFLRTQFHPVLAHSVNCPFFAVSPALSFRALSFVHSQFHLDSLREVFFLLCIPCSQFSSILDFWFLLTLQISLFCSLNSLALVRIASAFFMPHGPFFGYRKLLAYFSRHHSECSSVFQKV